MPAESPAAHLRKEGEIVWIVAKWKIVRELQRQEKEGWIIACLKHWEYTINGCIGDIPRCHGLIYEEGAQKVGVVIFTSLVLITPQVLASLFLK